MPGQRRPPSKVSVILTGLGGVVAGVLIFLLVLAVTGPKSTRQTEQASFKVGSAKVLARTVDRDGPLVFQDLLGGSRHIFVQHLDDDTWRAFDIYAPDNPQQCALQWQAAARQFLDPCTQRTYPADGEGLAQYPTEVDKGGTVIVHLVPA